MFIRRTAIWQFTTIWLAIFIAISGSTSDAFAERVVTDMAGRTVRIPDTVTRVGTIGPVPVLNSFVFAMGEADTIVNNLPPNLGGPRWRFQYLIAPNLAKQPVIQSGEGPSIEGILHASPNVVLTMDRPTIDLLERTHIPAIYLSWRQPDDVKTAMRLLGEIYGRPDTAEAYCQYFDNTLAKVSTRIEGLHDDQRPRVLYGDLTRLTQPHHIAEWWIAKAGGRSVTDNGRSVEAFTFSLEQVLSWDPEIIIVTTEPAIAATYADSRLANVSAIKNRRVYAVPMGAHVWGNRTVEQPLTILWAAKLFHPELFKDIVIEDEVRSFYSAFFKTSLRDDDIKTILAGRAGRP